MGGPIDFDTMIIYPDRYSFQGKGSNRGRYIVSVIEVLTVTITYNMYKNVVEENSEKCTAQSRVKDLFRGGRPAPIKGNLLIPSCRLVHVNTSAEGIHNRVQGQPCCGFPYWSQEWL